MSQRGLFNLRKALVVIQFTISIALIAGSLIIYQQINYIRSTQLGFNKDEVLVIRNYGGLTRETSSAFQNSLVQIPGVKDAATADGVVGGQNWTTGLNVKGSKNNQLINFLSVGNDFLNVLGIQLKEGRGFSTDFPADTLTNVGNGKLEQDIGSIIINERAVKDLGILKPVLGKQLSWANDGDTNYYVRIIGVVKDFHFASFRNEIKPFAFVNIPARSDYLTIKLSTKNISSTLQQIENKWKAFAAGRPLQYFFLDETFAQLYKAEANFQKLFIVLVALSIIIACLGLFALAAFTAEQRMKEIGIRKVLGASVARITTMLSSDFLKLIIISVLIATPLAWWVMSQWLQDYPYRIQISGWIFLLAALISILIAIITVSFRAIKAAMANPVKSLRTE